MKWNPWRICVAVKIVDGRQTKTWHIGKRHFARIAVTTESMRVVSMVFSVPAGYGAPVAGFTGTSAAARNLISSSSVRIAGSRIIDWNGCSGEITVRKACAPRFPEKMPLMVIDAQNIRKEKRLILYDRATDIAP